MATTRSSTSNGWADLPRGADATATSAAGSPHPGRLTLAVALAAACVIGGAACTCESGAPCGAAINELAPDEAAALCGWMYDTAGLERQHQCERWCVAVGARADWISSCAAALADCDAASNAPGCTTADLESCYGAHRGAPCELAAAQDCDGLSFCCAHAFMLDFWGSAQPAWCSQLP